MQTNLAPEHMQFLHAAVASGKYQNETEALNEALWLLKRRDELLTILEVGEQELDAGLGLPGEEVLDRLEKRAIELQRGGESHA